MGLLDRGTEYGVGVSRSRRGAELVEYLPTLPALVNRGCVS
jgi:hypothetical protein